MRQPKLRLKNNGGWCVRWNAEDHYFSRDKAIAEQMFYVPDSDHVGSLRAWFAWRTDRADGLAPASTAKPSLTIVDAAARMLDDYESASRNQAADYFRKHLVRFLGVHGEASIIRLTESNKSRQAFIPPLLPLLEAYKLDFKRPEDQRQFLIAAKLSPATRISGRSASDSGDAADIQTAVDDLIAEFGADAVRPAIEAITAAFHAFRIPDDEAELIKSAQRDAADLGDLLPKNVDTAAKR